jgi:hypothetical protein
VTGSGLWPRPTLIVCHLCPRGGARLPSPRKAHVRGAANPARVYSAHHYLPQRRSRVSLRHARSPAGPAAPAHPGPHGHPPLATKRPTPWREAPAPTAPRSRQTRPPTRCWPRRRLPSADRQALAAGETLPAPSCSGTSAAGSALARTRSPCCPRCLPARGGHFAPALADGAGPSLARCPGLPAQARWGAQARPLAAVPAAPHPLMLTTMARPWCPSQA